MWRDDAQAPRSKTVVSPPLSARYIAFAFTLTGIALAAGAAVGAETSLDVLCTKPDGSDPRLIEVVSDGPNRLPCETWYTKWGTRTQKASATSAEGHCEKIAHRIQSNLQGASFTCGIDADVRVAPDEALPHVSAAPPKRDQARSAAPSTRVESSSAQPSSVVEVASLQVDAAPLPPIDDATPSESVTPDKVTVAPNAQEDISVGRRAPAETAAVSHEATELAFAQRSQQDAYMAPSRRDDRRRVTPARLRAHVNAFMTERPGCRADLDGAQYAADESFAVVQWSCELASSGYAAHLLAIFADGTAPASLRIGGALAKSAKVRTIDDEGRVEIQTKLYKSDDPECCPSIVQVDAYRVDRFLDAGSIERLAD